MKKRIISLLLLIPFLLCVFLTSCDPSPFYYNYEELSANVSSVEWINYDNPNPQELFEESEKVKPFDFSKMQVIATLPEENKDSFLLELSDIGFLMIWRHLDSPQGEGIKINYEDGSFDVICFDVAFSCQYDNMGNVAFYIGSGGRELRASVENSFSK